MSSPIWHQTSPKVFGLISLQLIAMSQALQVSMSFYKASATLQCISNFYFLRYECEACGITSEPALKLRNGV